MSYQEADFQIKVEDVTVQRYYSADGKAWDYQHEAAKRNEEIRAEMFEEEITQAVESYCNEQGFVPDSRNRKQKENVLRPFLLWFKSWDGTAVEYVPVEEPKETIESKPVEEDQPMAETLAQSYTQIPATEFAEPDEDGIEEMDTLSENPFVGFDEDSPF